MDTISLTLRLPADVHDALRREAFDKHTSISALVRESIEARAALAEANRKIEAALALHVHQKVAISASSMGHVKYSQGCRYCGSSWPCVTVRALSTTDPNPTEGNQP